MNSLFRIKYYLKSNFKGYLEETVFKLRTLFYQERQFESKFVLFGGGRNGSTLLVSLLNSHPDIYCDGEILVGKLRSPFKHIKRRMQSSPKSIYGFKLLSYQLKEIQNSIDDKKLPGR